jgi:hypothetical protein
MIQPEKIDEYIKYFFHVLIGSENYGAKNVRL